MADNEGEVSKFDPKHRIIGAIILVSLAVIFIPMILDEHKTPPDIKSGSEAPAGQPAGAADTKVVVTPVTQLEAANGGTAAEARQPASGAPAASAEPAAKPGIGTAVERVEAPAKAAESTTAAKVAKAEAVDRPAKIAKGWIVQVGVYSNPENAKHIQEKLHGHGYPVRKDSVKLEGGKAVRLRVGPYQEKAAAERAQSEIRKQLGVQALVRAYP